VARTPTLQPAGAAASQGSSAPAPAGGSAAGRKLLSFPNFFGLHSFFLSLIFFLVWISNFIARDGGMFTGFLQIAAAVGKATWRRIGFVLEIKKMSSVKLQKKRRRHFSTPFARYSSIFYKR
jgi:hypothetical protein